MFALAVALASLNAIPIKAAKFEPVGFTCVASDGAIRRVNIDLRGGNYDEGQGLKEIDEITETKIILRGPNPFLVGGAGGMGPVISSLELDRISLVLKDEVLIPNRNVNRQANYQCEIGAAINFGAGRQF